ncbi:MAG: ParB/RepB/Spo0J family partition protein [Anaerolineae bacterium]
MARKRATVSPESAQRALGTDLLDRILQAEGLAEVPIIEVALARIDPNPYQTRREFDEAGLQELATSMMAHGFYGHLVARQTGQRYQLAYGERRLRAALQAGLTRLPLAVRDLSDEQMMELAVTENVLRKDLNPIEEAEAYQLLADLGYSLRQISARVGKSPGHISLLLSLLKKEDVAETVRQERIGLREAHEIARVEDAATRRALLERTARGELDREAVRQAVRLARQEPAAGAGLAEAPPAAPPPPPPPGPGAYDPRPNLRAALKRFEKIRPDRLADIEEGVREDIRALLDEIAARARYLQEQLGDSGE